MLKTDFIHLSRILNTRPTRPLLSIVVIVHFPKDMVGPLFPEPEPAPLQAVIAIAVNRPKAAKLSNFLFIISFFFLDFNLELRTECFG
jgi:hypothetical protein